jgi:hypothetical protein
MCTFADRVHRLRNAKRRVRIPSMFFHDTKPLGPSLQPPQFIQDKETETPNMPLSQMLLNIFTTALDFLAVLASAFTLPGPASAANQTPQIRQHQHVPAKGGDDDHEHTSSQAAWLESRGYRDSFAKDDEIKPDPKEDVMICD